MLSFHSLIYFTTQLIKIKKTPEIIQKKIINLQSSHKVEGKEDKICPILFDVVGSIIS